MAGRSFFFDSLSCAIANDLIRLSEEKGDTPDTGKSHHGVDDARKKSCGAAADPGYDIKLKKSDRAPVERANDC